MSSVKSYLIYLYFSKEKELVIVEMMLLSILEFVFCNKKYVFDSMGNIKGLSGLLWFILIVCLAPIEFKRDGIMGGLMISALALLNIFSDIFKYKYSFLNEKRSVIILWSFLPLSVLFLYILIKVGMK